ncbi:hypothetical protein LCGC14_2546210 [marine sediment metagenome]|uniref:Signal recognition particle SRP54 helical bundle domain-containing protein n=1 Tax=marine sediment metagenome TaxID=412755 RepID=A0A0F9AP78_9ZZZZ
MKETFESVMTRVLRDAKVSDSTLEEVRDKVDEVSSLHGTDSGMQELKNACDNVLNAKE